MSAIKSGYKQTEMGVIPEDWGVEPLSDLLKTRQLGGNYPNTEELSPSPLIKMGNMGRGTIVLDKIEYIAPGIFVNDRDLLRYGDVLLNTRNTLDLVGKVCVWRDELPKAYFNSNILRLEPFPGKIKPSIFLNFVLNSHRSVDSIRSLAIGTTSVAAIYTRDLDRLAIVVPPLPEQQAIAEALGDADALIEALEALIAKKRDIKQGAIQDLLTGHRRLPGFQGEWIECRLGSLGSFAKGSGVKKDEANSGPLPCVRYGELYTHHTDIIRRFNSHISAEVAKGTLRLRSGDVLFAGSGETKEDIGKCAALVDDVEAYAGGDIVVLRPSGSSAEFLGCYLNCPDVQRQKASRGQGDAVVHISPRALASIDLKLPPTLNEQRAIAAVLSDMDAEIAALEGKLAKARDVKQGMMQVLLTGEIRLV